MLFRSQKFLAGLKGPDLRIALSWDEWMGITAPYAETSFTQKEVTARFHRNGYDWDNHGTLYTPAKEVNPKTAFLIIHGGSGNEHAFDLTPDGRPAPARVLAAQGFIVLSLSYTGLYPPGGTWSKPAATRMPHYLLDRDLPEAEILDRNLKCTRDVMLQGFAALVDKHLAGRDILEIGRAHV